MAKLTLKYGDVSIDYDGPEDFLKDHLADIVKAVGSLKDIAPAAAQAAVHKSDPPAPLGQANTSVSTIAHKLGVKSGPDLIASAALSLALGGTPAFKKKDLRTRSREAKTIWKKSYSNNFDNYVNRLVTSQRLNHVGGDDYALPNTEQAAMSARLASAK